MAVPFRRRYALALLGSLPLTACAVTPEPLTDSELQHQASIRLSRAAEIRTPVRGSLTLADAIARAVQYNLDHHIERFETALRQAELGASNADMLPSLVASTSTVGRNNQLASSSFNVITNVPNFGASTSQDRRLSSADLSFSWNILDFGLSYVRARQAADKALIAEENRRRVLHKLVEDVRTTYWRAYAAQKLTQKLKSLETRTARAMARARQQAGARETSPVAALTYRRELIEIQRVVREMQRELASARIQLAALINERPDSALSLVTPKRIPLSAALSGAPRDLINMALAKRPELRDLSYRRRINMHELDAALLELLPGIQPFFGTNYDSNSFLLHEQWIGWGVKASWNLMRLIQHPHRRAVIEAQDAVIEQRDRAMTLAVMTQIHVSRARLAVVGRELETARSYREVQSALVRQIRSEFQQGRVSEQTLLREELNQLIGEIRELLAEGAVAASHASLAAAVGIDPPGWDEVVHLPRTADAWIRRTMWSRTSMTSQ